MKLVTILTLTGIVYASATSYAQEHHISVRVNNGTFYEVVSQIEKQSEFMFFYKSEEIDNNQPITLVAVNQTVPDILNELIKKQGLSYRIFDKHILITKAAPLAQQQGKRISGTVIDENSEPIIGANVVEKGTTNGVITDIGGHFTLNVRENTTLQISYIGYIPQEISVKNETTLLITLKEDFQSLNEVVVVGYGTMRKIDVTGAMTSIAADQIDKAAIKSVDQMLQGRSSGLHMVQSSGMPGAG
ncbi:MAG: carboxypeptidase-like regulatory domain-containing protein, partial [Tannerellaceae bacterium]|nr:carboxypeptidase-like regulatory domain-containing protein [Tannerellaceae bacterium]